MKKPFSKKQILDVCPYLCAFGIVIPLLITWNLWITDRLYPMIPLIEGLPLNFVSGKLSFAVYVIALLAITAAVFKRLTTPALIIYLSIVAFWILQDISRNLIWFYMYNFIVLALLSWSIYRNKNPDSEDPGYLNNIRAIICGTYIWGGLNKINLYFYFGVLPWFMSPVIPNVLDYKLGLLFVLLVPFFEAFIGLGLMLLNGWKRMIPLFFAFCMMCHNLYLLGPFGHNWGAGVWSWNLIIFLFAFFLFWKQGDEVNFKSILFPKTWLKWPIFICIFIGPAGWYWGLWPTHNSFLMYDGLRQEAYYTIPDEFHDSLPPILQETIKEYGNEFRQNEWAVTEFQANGVAIEKVQYRLADIICSYTGKTDKVTMMIQYPPVHPFAMREEKTFYPCIESQ